MWMAEEDGHCFSFWKGGECFPKLTFWPAPMFSEFKGKWK